MSEGLCRGIEHSYILLNKLKLDGHFIDYVSTGIRCLSDFLILSWECNLDCCATTFHAPLPPLMAHKLLVYAIYVKLLPLVYNLLATLCNLLKVAKYPIHCTQTKMFNILWLGVVCAHLTHFCWPSHIRMLILWYSWWSLVSN